MFINGTNTTSDFFLCFEKSMFDFMSFKNGRFLLYSNTADRLMVNVYDFAGREIVRRLDVFVGSYSPRLSFIPLANSSILILR